MSQSIAAVLQAADARLTPETWTQRMTPESYADGKECPHFAIDACAPTMKLRNAGLALFAEVVSGDVELSGIWFWNDRPGRSLSEIHEAFAASIAIAQSQEQSVREEVPCAG